LNRRGSTFDRGLRKPKRGFRVAAHYCRKSAEKKESATGGKAGKDCCLIPPISLQGESVKGCSLSTQKKFDRKRKEDAPENGDRLSGTKMKARVRAESNKRKGSCSSKESD